LALFDVTDNTPLAAACRPLKQCTALPFTEERVFMSSAAAQIQQPSEPAPLHGASVAEQPVSIEMTAGDASASVEPAAAAGANPSASSVQPQPMKEKQGKKNKSKGKDATGGSEASAADPKPAETSPGQVQAQQQGAPAVREPRPEVPPDTTTPITVELLEGRDAFSALEKEWNAALAKGPRDEPMLRHEWLKAHFENFTPSAPLRVFVARTGKELQAAIPFVEKVERNLDTCGLSMTTWELPASDHSQRGGVLVGRRGVEALLLLWDLIKVTPGWDRLRLRDLPEGVSEWKLREVAERDGFPVGLWSSLHSPFVNLPEGKPAERYAKVEALVDSKFRANLRRRRKRLTEKHGEVAYVRVDNKNAAALDVGLADFFDLEACGWKGEGGSAIALDPKLVGYYTQLARDAARRGALHLSFIEAGKKRIAGHLAIAHAGRFFLVKVGYDDAIRTSCEQGLREFDFLGPDMSWKDDWEPKLRTHTWLTIFRPSRAGKLVHGARFIGWPVARAVIAQVKEKSAQVRSQLEARRDRLTKKTAPDAPEGT